MQKLYYTLSITALVFCNSLYSMKRNFDDQSIQETHYTILGVLNNATTEEIKRSYKQLVLQCHPDKNPGDKIAEERFKLILTAYDVLKDAEERTKYDNSLPSFIRFNSSLDPSVYTKLRFKPNSLLEPSFIICCEPRKSYSIIRAGECYRCSGEASLYSQKIPRCCFFRFLYLCDACCRYLASNHKGIVCPHCSEIIVIKLSYPYTCSLNK